MKDLSKEVSYEAVKKIIECEHSHILLPQQKLFTLVTLAMQYMMFESTKNPGSYIIRVEDSSLYDKITRKSKDMNIRKFFQRLSLPRKIKFEKSTFYLDFFHVSSWNITKDIPSERLRGAMIIKNTNPNPMLTTAEGEENEEDNSFLLGMENNLFLNSLLGTCPKTITIAFDQSFEGTHPLKFDFIKEEAFEHMAYGVKIAGDVDFKD